MRMKNETQETQYWKISPGQGGYLWREQKLNECIAIGWSEIGNAQGMTEGKLRTKFNHRGWSTQAFKQFTDFLYRVRKEDKVVASSSGTGIYALGTVIGDYEFNEELEYKHSRKVRWETTFWHPVDIASLCLPRSFEYKFSGQSSQTIRDLTEKEWDCLSKRLNNISTPFRNLGMWGGLIQSPEYENEVIILFSHMLQHLHMRIIKSGTLFPDAIIERKVGKKWKKTNVEFELRSHGFQAHLPDCKENEDYVIICWEDDWRDNRQKKRFEIIELKKQLEKIL
jgi:hypothetical protein